MKKLAHTLKTTFFVTFFLMICQAASAGPFVLFDQAHGQHFLVEKNGALDLSGLATLFTEQGATIKTSSAAISDTLLNEVDVLIISGPFAPITQNEAISIMKFLYRGGKLALMMHISQPFGTLLPQLGIAVSSAAVSEQENIIGTNAKDFQVKDLKSHPLTTGLTSFNVYGGWALLNTKSGVDIVGQTTHKAWVDLNQNGELNEKDAMQSFAMVLAGQMGKGSFAVFGDDAIFQNQFLKDGNLLLGRNLALWFCGEKQSI
ncbi:MAG: GldG family protein [Desulfobulbaceae bacterium]|nr:GldG family protein [Desulfobulbaceae bacterium]